MAIAVSHRFSPSGDLPVEAGRYRLVASGACPWCRRVLIARRLLGLTEAIPVSWSYGKGADGYWELTGPDGEPGVDPALGARSLAEVYEKTPGYTPPRYLVGGPGWSGAGPAAVGMMSCPCP